MAHQAASVKSQSAAVVCAKAWTRATNEATTTPFKTSESQRSPMIYSKQMGQDQKTNGAQIVANDACGKPRREVTHGALDTKSPGNAPCPRDKAPTGSDPRAAEVTRTSPKALAP